MLPQVPPNAKGNYYARECALSCIRTPSRPVCQFVYKIFLAEGPICICKVPRLHSTPMCQIHKVKRILASSVTCPANRCELYNFVAKGKDTAAFVPAQPHPIFKFFNFCSKKVWVKLQLVAPTVTLLTSSEQFNF